VINKKILLTEVFAMFERWTLMILVSFWSLVGIGDCRMLLRGDKSVTIMNIFLCLSESVLGLFLLQKVLDRKNGIILRAAIVVMAVVMFWLQANPWMQLNDAPTVVHGSLHDEFVRQRIIQYATFTCFAVPFILIDFLPFRNREFRDQLNRVMNHKSLLATYLLSTLPLAGVVLIKCIGGTSEGLASHFIVVMILSTIVLLELARRSVCFNDNILGVLIIVAYGPPIMLLLLF